MTVLPTKAVELAAALEFDQVSRNPAPPPLPVACTASWAMQMTCGSYAVEVNSDQELKQRGPLGHRPSALPAVYTPPACTRPLTSVCPSPLVLQ